jgi:nitrogen regulatory protein PII-like uncharacterized protein
MPNPVKDIIYQALQDSASNNIVMHTIDDENGVIEINYEKITKAILKSLNNNGYKIVKMKSNNEN